MRGRLRGARLLILLAVPPVVAGCGGHAGEVAATRTQDAPEAVPVTVAPVGHRTVERSIEVVGTLRGWEDVTVGSKKPGRVVRVLHDMGDRVRPGEPLVELETVDADLAVEQAEKTLQAELARLGLSEMPPSDFDITTVPTVVQSRVALERAQQHFQRERSLTQRGAGTHQDLQDAENDLKAAEASLEAAALSARSILAGARASKVALEVARQARRDLEIRAPMPAPGASGRDVLYAVSKKKVAEGQMLNQGEAVFELVIADPLRLWANVPERFASEVQLGQPVRLTVAAFPGETFTGSVARINPAVDATSRTFQVEAVVPNADGRLRPGGFAKAWIVVRRDAEATVVPLESIVRFAGVTKLFVVEEGAAREVQVETGLEGLDWVEVDAALPESTPVVITGQTQLANGTPVVVRTPEPGPDAKAPAPASAPAPPQGEAATDG